MTGQVPENLLRGGQPLRDAALASLTSAIRGATAAGSVRLLSVRHDFPTEWAVITATQLTRAPPHR